MSYQQCVESQVMHYIKPGYLQKHLTYHGAYDFTSARALAPKTEKSLVFK